jgi:hypothetical protein
MMMKVERGCRSGLVQSQSTFKVGQDDQNFPGAATRATVLFWRKKKSLHG